MKINLILQAESLGESLAGGSEDADGVGFVEEKERSEAFF